MILAFKISDFPMIYENNEEGYLSIITNSVNCHRINRIDLKFDMVLIIHHKAWGYRTAYINQFGQVIDGEFNSTIYMNEIHEMWVIEFDADIGI